jgi:hypothetical protein
MAAPNTTAVCYGPVAGASDRLQSAVRRIPTDRLRKPRMSEADTSRLAAPWSADYSHDYSGDPANYGDDSTALPW